MALLPRKASATGRHEAATAALTETQVQLTDLTARRDKALLADDVAGAVKLGVEIENVQRLAGAHRQRLVLLAEEVQKEANERRVQARLANLPPCLIGMEACVGAHHLSRKLQALGHDARLMPAKYVRRTARDKRTTSATPRRSLRRCNARP